MFLNCGVGDSWESLGAHADPTSSSLIQEISPEFLTIHWKHRCWNSNTLATWCEELTQKRPWCWERLKAGEGNDRRWNGWTASLTQWTWVWVNSGSWWWTGRPSMLWFTGLLRVGHDWETELNWTHRKKKRKRKPSRVAGYKIYMLKTNTWKLKRCNNEHDLNPLQYSCLENPMDGGAS